MTSDILLTRRRALLLAAAAFAPIGSLHASPFWDKKDPSDWTSEEVDQLLTKSPWAKEVNAQFTGGSGQGGGYPGGGQRRGGGMGGGLGIPGIGGIGGMGGGGRRGGMGRGGAGRGQATSLKAKVLWESAKPIVQALKNPLPEAFANHYVISVSGVPLRPDTRNNSSDQDQDDEKRMADLVDNLKQFTTLRPKGKDLVQAGVVQRVVGSGPSFLFGFSKETLDLGDERHELLFETQLTRYNVKASFEPKDMKYRGTLAV